MKIGIYTPYLDTLTGGEKYMLTIASCLAQRNQVFLFWNPAEEEKIKNKAKEKLAIDIDNVKFTQNIFSPNVTFFKRILASRQYDVIIVLSDGSIPFLLTRLFLHLQFPTEWVETSLKTKLKISRVEKIICNSIFTKAFIDKKFNTKSAVLYPPIIIPELKKVKKENIILNVGRFSQAIEGTNFKKQDILIEIFKALVDSGVKNWKFVLVLAVRDQDLNKVEELKKLAKGYPVEFLINVKNERLWQAYQEAKIYWHATGFGEDLEKNPERAEHFGISTVEAMSAGAVPVVINAGGQKEIVDTNNNGFLWNTKEECIEKTKQLLSDTNLLESMSQAAIQKAKTFSSRDFCSELSKILGNV